MATASNSACRDPHLEFSAEPLESRKMLAGVVEFEFEADGDVKIHGDDGRNQILVGYQEASGTLELTGLQGTMITV